MHKFDRTLILLVLGLVVLIIIFIGIFYYYSYLKAYNENLALLDIKGFLNEKQNESIDPYCYALFY